MDTSIAIHLCSVLFEQIPLKLGSIVLIGNIIKFKAIFKKLPKFCMVSK